MRERVRGFDQVGAMLERLEQKPAKQTTRKALREGAKIIRLAVAAEAPKRSGLTANSVKVRAGKSRKGRISMIVGIGKKWFTGPTFYAAFVEFGHFVGSRKFGDNRNKVAANNFVRRGFDRSKKWALVKMYDVYKELLKP